MTYEERVRIMEHEAIQGRDASKKYGQAMDQFTKLAKKIDTFGMDRARAELHAHLDRILDSTATAYSVASAEHRT